MKYTEKITNRLNDLLEKTYDAEKGYKLAADEVKDPYVKEFLNDKVKQRRAFGFELKAEIMEYGQLPEKGGSFKGDLHRVWMRLKPLMGSDKTEQILEEVARGENASLEEYNDILKSSETRLPPTTERLLIQQRDAIQAALNTSKMYEELHS
ncbi:ferritin-like domain-containing protein [Robiginitalea aurantiaca]|uniref:PA2169 family four-helix-bundle protein n=1 Tax=Robiginitalea aurantiaca TaxID=3056915 RepID=A0ABT7WBN4_9FLAO|nr:PA2169 family four-helix-bundle protein [Robiginitalea aurantiaca]MDM9630314.1 PA2169 family four-helix-bundle protein [Robiginitalea aurantiaca]